MYSKRKHPHTRGEDSHGVDGSDQYVETPPHTWGRHNDNEFDNEFDRNTPTHVGKTYFDSIGHSWS